MVTITEDQLTARAVDLGELATRLQTQHTARQDVVAPARRLRMDGGRLIAELPTGDPIVSPAGISSAMALRPTDLGLGDIADKLGIPVGLPAADARRRRHRAARPQRQRVARPPGRPPLPRPRPGRTTTAPGCCAPC